MTVEVNVNDYCAKGLSGGKVAVFLSQEVLDTGFIPENNVIVGNVCLYSATSGKALFRGKGGEQFCVHNSGVIAVVEGVGDYCAECMTGGRLVVLGETDRNFGASMSRGIACIYDPSKIFPKKVNMGLVGLESLDDNVEKEAVFNCIKEYVQYTNSAVGQDMLENLEERARCFVKVMPHNYKSVLLERTARDDKVEAT